MTPASRPALLIHTSGGSGSRLTTVTGAGALYRVHDSEGTQLVGASDIVDHLLAPVVMPGAGRTVLIGLAHDEGRLGVVFAYGWDGRGWVDATDAPAPCDIIDLRVDVICHLMTLRQRTVTHDANLAAVRSR